MSSAIRVGAFSSAMNASPEISNSQPSAKFTPHGDAEEAITELLRLVSESKTLRFDLGVIDSNWTAWHAFLEKCKTLREDRVCELILTCEVGDEIDASLANLLTLSGVRFVRLSGEASPPLSRIRSVKHLSSAGIIVNWSLPKNFKPAENQLPELMSHWHHLPPPNNQHSDSSWSDSIEQSIQLWQACHRLRSLTYARGPGFVKILDRRTDPRAWAFTVLEGISAEAFLLMREGCTVDAIAEKLTIPNSSLEPLISRLVHHNLVATLDDIWFLALPIRRAVEERWVSAVY